jgi:protein involved in polysaccharide export with SLBB domain
MNPAVSPPSQPACFARLTRRLLLAAALLAGAASGGCAALTNPVADAVPVHRLPPEVLGKRKEEEKTIPLTLLRQKPPDVYRLGPGDVLGVVIDGVLGEPKQPPPYHVPEVGTNVQPALGYPYPVDSDGTIPLPLLAPDRRLKVTGMTLAEAQSAIFKAYTDPKKIINPENSRVLVSLIKQRQYHVLVVRQDSGALTVGQGGAIGQTKRGTGFVLNLPAYENDVLNALARTGGLPGLDAQNEVIIERGSFRDFDDKDAVLRHVDQCGPGGVAGGLGGQRIRIPLRLRPEEMPPFKPEDVILHDGDIVFIEARDTEVFYTGGLLPARQFILPRDYDLDVVQAVAFAQGPFVNGNLNQNNLSGNVVQSGIGFPSPSLLTILRRTPGGGQIPIRVSLNEALRDPRKRVLIQPGDFIILQETPDEAIVRYITEQWHFTFFGTFIRRNDLLGTTTLNLP